MGAQLSCFRTAAPVSRRTFIVGAMASAAAIGAPSQIHGQGGRLALRRGGSIHSALNWPELEAGSHDRFLWPPFAAAKYQMSPRLLKAFRRAGLDFIRLTVDPGIFMATQGMRRDELDAILLSRCRLILDAGMAVVVDFHPIMQVPAWTADRIVTDAATNRAFIELIGRTAGALRALDASKVALEAMNEPPHGYDKASAERWQHMLARMHKAARAAHPDLTLVLTGAASGGILGLKNVDARAFADDNIYWSFHYYSPHHFTHQGVVTSQSNMLHFRYLTDLPYPSDAANPELATEMVRQAVRADRSLNALQRVGVESAAINAVRAYFSARFDARSIAADFDEVTSWAQRQGVKSERILLGEFGAARRNQRGNGALNRHRLDWMRDVRQAAEQRNFAWALWDIDDDQMGLVTRRGSNLLDGPTLQALGLDDIAG